MPMGPFLISPTSATCLICPSNLHFIVWIAYLCTEVWDHDIIICPSSCHFQAGWFLLARIFVECVTFTVQLPTLWFKICHTWSISIFNITDWLADVNWTVFLLFLVIVVFETLESLSLSKCLRVNTHCTTFEYHQTSQHNSRQNALHCFAKCSWFVFKNEHN